jgi:predicted unusual protein kinase regulating ubiquinone biosynthesis (AarF/ABC1/UbiB family)
MKIQRPDLAMALAVDLVLLKRMAAFTRWVMGRFCATTLDPVRVVEAWAKTMWRELDYIHEARSMELMRERLCCGRNPVAGLVIPKVCWDLTSPRVLTTEWVNGLKVTEQPKSITASHIRIGVEAYAAMILDIGLIHADPHAGNLMTTSSGDLVLLDFGMTEAIPESHRQAWAHCLVHLVRGDHGATLDDLIHIGFFKADCPREVILPVMSQIWTEIVRCGSDTKKRKQAVRTCYDKIKILVRDFDFDLPDYYLALVRALLTMEGIALTADCDFDIFRVTFPVALRAITTGRGGPSRRSLMAAAGGRALDQLGSYRGTLAFLGLATVALTVGAVVMQRGGIGECVSEVFPSTI